MPVVVGHFSFSNCLLCFKGVIVMDTPRHVTWRLVPVNV